MHTLTYYYTINCYYTMSLSITIINIHTIDFLRDTAGQERFRALTTAYYRGAMGILLMYDVTSLESFNHLSYWLRNIQEVRIRDNISLIILFAGIQSKKRKDKKEKIEKKRKE